MPDADKVTLEQIYDALVQAYTNTPIPGTKWKLTAAHKPDNIVDVSDDKLPFLLFDIGNMTLSDWKPWEKYVTWNLSATLKVKGEPGDTDKIFLRVLNAFLLRTVQVLGLPVDAKGNVVPYTQATATMFDRDELTFLADRGAPLVTGVQSQPSDGKYSQATIQFGVQCVLDLDPRTLPIAKVAIMDISSYPNSGINSDSTLPDSHAVTLGYDTASPVAGGDAQGVAGTPPSQQIRGVNVTPYSLSLSVGTPTGALTAIATFADWSSSPVTPLASWSSSNAAVATVDASGVVHRVAAGTCTVSCTYAGASSNAVAVTCS